MNCLMLGSGSWAIGVATVLAHKGTRVWIWCRRAERAAEIAAGRHAYFPGLVLPAGISPILSSNATAELRGQDLAFAIAGVPTQHLAGVLGECREWLPRQLQWVSLAKGLELNSLRLPSVVLEESGIPAGVAVLSGPSHAEEVVLGMPTAVVLGHGEQSHGKRLQDALSGERFRVYLNGDRQGVELGGALKNVTAIAAGIAVGQGFGDNTLAALVIRGGVEMARLGVALGGRRETFGGLSGVGDLMVTCFSKHSRNRAFGVRVGSGERVADVLSSMSQVVEGVPTTRAVVELSRRLGITMPIAEEVHGILYEGKAARTGVQNLLRRSLKEE